MTSAPRQPASTPSAQILAKLAQMDPAGQARLLAQLENGRKKPRVEDPARDKFLPFVRAMWPSFREGIHHAALANAFERIANGSLRRLMVNMPPRHGKSECASVHLPPWFLGKHPDRKVIFATHSEKLSVSFGRRVRNMVKDPDFTAIFPECEVSKDAKASGKWSTTKGGEYYAIGVEGRLAGRGADLMLIDDPHSEQDAITGGDLHYERVYDWYQTGPRQRLQPGAAVIISATRWSKKDLCGRLMADARADRMADQWEVISLPALLPDGKPLFPEFWPQSELEVLKRTLPSQRWNAQYQQNPTSDEASIVKQSWWKPWLRRAPQCIFTVQSWDTSFGEYAKGDPSACTLWGVFEPRKEPGQPQSAPPFGIILLDAFEERLPFPELKQKALELYRRAKPDSLCIEARAAGSPLLQELGRLGLPIARYAPTCGSDKTVRLNAVSDLFRSGMIWYLEGCTLAHRTIQQFADHPNGDGDDLMDCSVQALARIREGGWIRLSNDEADLDEDAPRWMPPRPPEGGYY